MIPESSHTDPLLRSLFAERFGDSEGTFTLRAPGRVNLIGEHVDYNGGFVLPMALPLQTVLCVRRRDDRQVTLYSRDFDTTLSFSLDNMTKRDEWSDYVAGVAQELETSGIALTGLEGVVATNVPVASGLSSSAAIEVGSALAFLHAVDMEMTPVEVARLCQRAENRFVGVQSGIMDQMAVAACHKDHALLLDCRALHMEQVPMPSAHHAVVVTDSAAPRELASGAYNERVRECHEGLNILRQYVPDAATLRDIPPATFYAHAGAMPEVVRKRVTHVIEEIARTQKAADALKGGDMVRFGELMNASHRSLAELYQVTSPELDWLTSWARHQSGVLGSRMTGAGFGGCIVTLIEREHAEAFVAALPHGYRDTFGREARSWICEATDGAGLMSESGSQRY